MANESLTKPFADYPHIRQVGSLYFLAGQGCRDPDTDRYRGTEIDEQGEVVRYDIAEQTRGVFANLERALTSCELRPEHLVDVTVFLRDMADFAEFNKVWNDYFAERASPTRTTVGVTRLPGHNFVEMKAIASRTTNQ